MSLWTIVATSLPFLTAYALQLLELGMRPLAENTLKTLLSDKRVLTGWPREIAIQLALHFYKQFSFIGSALLSAAAALAFTPSSKDKQLLVTIVTFVVIILMAIWIFRWQPLARRADAKHNSRCDKEMKIASVVSTTLIFLLSLYSIS